MNNLLKVKNINKSYGDLKVLQDVSLKINKGEIVTLLGPSGSGKTTLFKIAAGLIKQDEGEVIVDKSSRIGYVFQEPRLLPWRKIKENFNFVQRNFMSKEQAKKLMAELLKLTNLENIIDSYPEKLSGGMKQRVEILKALSINPNLLIMDEPLKSVDTQTEVNLRKMLLNIHTKKNIDIFMITHDPEEAALLSDRIYVLSDRPGKIVKEFKIDKDKEDRTLKDDQVYDTINEIIDIFMELVKDYNWV
ncbi:MAG: ABC transporter ATP-binding protein [Halanaerobiales bacterium]|nr:ABC transporter ATP-binding protein [Halanaerobiales bacterium]